jgi:DNA-binding PadR family transcriptional regulator
MPNLSTTSYAILGLLSLRSFTTYELAEQMRRSLGQFWPRAESGIYTEPKKLVELGLATAETEFVGQRARQRYTITAAGRKALKQWIPKQSAPPQVECEGLLKVFFAERGTRDDLLRTLQALRDENAERAAGGQNIPHEYLDNRGAYPERLPWNILVGTFIDEWQQLLERWSTWAIGEVERWPDDIRAAEPDWAALQRQADHADEFVRRKESR